MYTIQNETMPSKAKTTQIKLNPPVKDDDEETTIDEVIEELRNIINDAETEQYLKEEKKKQQEKVRVAEVRDSCRIKMRVESNVIDSIFDKETDIVPSNLHPQPPRRTRSLVHLFIPAEDYDYGNKEIFFENETTFTSEEGSDSLLSASKCQLPRVEKEPVRNTSQETVIIKNTQECHKFKDKRKFHKERKNCVKKSESFKHILPNNITEISQNKSPKNSSFDGLYLVTTNTPLSPSFQKEKQETIEELTAHRLKSKSLDRIDDGLDAMVDIVMTDQPNIQRSQHKTEIRSSNRLLSRSISSVFVGRRKDYQVAKVNSNNGNEEKQRMFLPPKGFDCGERLEAPYYFPRLQEKRSATSTFLVKRGHVNAGLYSGYIVKDENNTSFIKKSEYIPTLDNRGSLGKLTDLPSGLY